MIWYEDTTSREVKSLTVDMVVLSTCMVPRADAAQMANIVGVELDEYDFVKTSSGYGFVKGPDGRYSYEGATEHDLRLMREHCSEKVRVKAAGGVRDLDALIRVRDLGCSRCGASATVAMLDEYRRREAAGE